jgi:hypothetical protein
MKISLSVSMVATTLALLGTAVLGSTVQAVPSTTPTEFGCGYEAGIWTTFVTRGRSTPVRLIQWRTEIGGYTPKERCELISERLNQVVEDNGGKLYGIRMKTGYMQGYPVICYITNRTSPFCDAKNHLMNLPKGSNPELELRRLFSLADAPYASGTPVQNSAQDYEVNFGEAVEKMLNNAESQPPQR